MSHTCEFLLSILWCKVDLLCCIDACFAGTMQLMAWSKHLLFQLLLLQPPLLPPLLLRTAACISDFAAGYCQLLMLPTVCPLYCDDCCTQLAAAPAICCVLLQLLSAVDC
jgi:hypothetical protein